MYPSLNSHQKVIMKILGVLTLFFFNSVSCLEEGHYVRILCTKFKINILKFLDK